MFLQLRYASYLKKLIVQCMLKFYKLSKAKLSDWSQLSDKIICPCFPEMQFLGVGNSLGS